MVREGGKRRENEERIGKERGEGQRLLAIRDLGDK